MNERLTKRGIAEILASAKVGLNKESADKFIEAFSEYIVNTIEKKQIVKVMGLGTFKVAVVRERESVHIQTGERFIIPSHHKLSFVPDKEFKENINRPFAFFEPIEANDIEDFSFNEKQGAPLVVIDEDESPSPDTNDAENEIDKTNVELTSSYKENNLTETDEKINVSEEPYMEETPETNDIQENQPEIKDYFSNQEQETTQSDIEDTYTEETYPEVEEFEEKIEEEEAEEVGEEEEYEELEEENDDEDNPSTNVSNIYDNQSDSENIEIQKQENRKKKIPTWVYWAAILSIAICCGLATYTFLYYNSPHSPRKNNIVMEKSNNNAPQVFEVMPPKEDLSNMKIYADILLENTDEQTATSPEKTTRVIDWLAPTVESSEPTKRADRPNEEIERRNAKLGKNKKNSDDKKQDKANMASNDTNSKKNTAKEVTKKMPAKVKMTQGSSLTQIAMEHYGDKIFWVYIYEYNKNRIKNYDNIPVGTELRLPSPKQYGIDAKSNASIEKARKKQREILHWDNWDDYK